MQTKSKTKMKYKNIKWVLRKQIERKVNLLWTWDKKQKTFTCIYNNYTDDLPILTPQQLIDEIEEEIKSAEKEIVS